MLPPLLLLLTEAIHKSSSPHSLSPFLMFTRNCSSRQLKQSLRQQKDFLRAVRRNKDRSTRKLEDGMCHSAPSFCLYPESYGTISQRLLVSHELSVLLKPPGLGSIYSPLYPPVPTLFSRNLSRDRSGSIHEVSATHPRLDEDGLLAFNSIMSEWKVFGGR